MQDPQIQLKELDLAFPDPLDAKTTAVLDTAHRSSVNYETFFFADEADRRRFDADPTASCGVLTDPVTKDRFRPGSDSPRATFGGRTYFFLTAENKAAFDTDPQGLALPNYDAIQIPDMR